jgi:hypothetical protein
VLIVHRCRDCGHPDVWGDRDKHSVLGLAGGLPKDCGQTNDCPPQACRWNPQPETMTRLNQAGQPIADVLPPGSEVPWLTARTTHNCQACRDLHTQLTGDQPATA